MIWRLISVFFGAAAIFCGYATIRSQIAPGVVVTLLCLMNAVVFWFIPAPKAKKAARRRIE